MDTQRMSYTLPSVKPQSLSAFADLEALNINFSIKLIIVNPQPIFFNFQPLCPKNHLHLRNFRTTLRFKFKFWFTVV